MNNLAENISINFYEHTEPKTFLLGYNSLYHPSYILNDKVQLEDIRNGSVNSRKEYSIIKIDNNIQIHDYGVTQVINYTVIEIEKL